MSTGEERVSNAMNEHRASLSSVLARTLCAGGLAAIALLPAGTALAQETSAAPEFTVPDTTSYLLLGLAVIVLILGIWAARLIVRFRSLHQDEATLAALDEE